MEHNSLAYMPLEILENIFKRTELFSVASICRVCKLWNELFSDSSIIWSFICGTSIKFNTNFEQAWRSKVWKLIYFYKSKPSFVSAFNYAYHTENHTPNAENLAFYLLTDCLTIIDGGLITIINLLVVAENPQANPMSFFSPVIFNDHYIKDCMNAQIESKSGVIQEYPFHRITYYQTPTELFGDNDRIYTDGKTYLFNAEQCVIWSREEFKAGVQTYKRVLDEYSTNPLVSISSEYLFSVDAGSLRVRKLSEKCCPHMRVSTTCYITPPRCLRCRDFYQDDDDGGLNLIGKILQIYALKETPKVIALFCSDQVCFFSPENLDYLVDESDFKIFRLDWIQKEILKVENVSEQATQINGMNRHFLAFTYNESGTIVVDLKDENYHVPLDSKDYRWIPMHNKIALRKGDQVEIYDLDQKKWQNCVTIDGLVDFTFDSEGNFMFAASNDQLVHMYHMETAYLIGTLELDPMDLIRRVFCYDKIVAVVTYMTVKIFTIKSNP